MKKLFTTLLLLMGAVLITNAQTKYLRVGDQEIDLTKNGTYTNIGNNNGTAKYVLSEKRLYLTNINLTDKRITGGYLSDATYYIRVESYLIIDNSNGSCMRFDESKVVFEGNGNQIYLMGRTTSSGYSTFDAEESDISFWNVFLYVLANGSNAFYGNSTLGKISFRGVWGNIQSVSGAAFKGFTSMSFDDCLMTTDNAKFVSGTGVTNSTNGSLMKYVSLEPFLRIGMNIIRTAGASSSGTGWSWDKSTQTLTLNNYEYDGTGSFVPVENSGVEGLTLKIQGTCKLTDNDDTAINSRKTMTISGDGANSTNLILKGERGIHVWSQENNSLTFNNINVSIDATDYGISGYSYTTDLSINKSSLTVLGQGSGSIINFKSCNLTDCDVNTAQNSNVCFRKSLNGFGTTSGIYKSTIYIRTLSADSKYNVYVLGHQVNSMNKSRVAVDGLTAGTISFDSDAKKLTLNGVTLEAPSGDTNSGIKISGGASSDTYTVSLAGTNTITANGDACYIGRTTEFTGSGKGFFISNTESGLSVYTPASVTLNSSNIIRFEGKKYGYYGSGGESEVLTMKKTSSDNYYYRFKGETKCINNLTSLKLDGMDFYGKGDNLKGCYFDESTKDVRQNGGKVAKGWVGFAAIKESYALYVADKKLNDLNATGVGSKYITSGDATAAVYDPSTNMLTLTNATITNKGEDMNALKSSGLDDLTINVVGDNTLMTERSGWNSGNTSVNLGGNTTITGNGTLNVKGVGPLYVANGKKLTFWDAKKVVTEASIRSSSPTSTAELVVNNSNVEAQSVCFFKSVKWLNGSLAEPVNGKFDPTSTYIVDANGNKATKVVFIDKDATAIDAVEVDRNADVRDIFDASGRQTQNARSGLNIIRMSDGTVRKVMVK